MRYNLATPLLFANLLHWIAPEIFRHYEISGGSVGAVKLVMDQDTAAADVKVTADDGSALPFTMRERTLNFFSGAPGGVKVVAGDREYLYSLTLPAVCEWPLPFARRRRALTFFSGARGGVKVVAGDREYLYSLTLPELWESKWT